MTQMPGIKSKRLVTSKLLFYITWTNYVSLTEC